MAQEILGAGRAEWITGVSLKTDIFSVQLSPPWGSSKRLIWNFGMAQGRQPNIAFLWRHSPCLVPKDIFKTVTPTGMAQLLIIRTDAAHPEQENGIYANVSPPFHGSWGVSQNGAKKKDWEVAGAQESGQLFVSISQKDFHINNQLSHTGTHQLGVSPVNTLVVFEKAVDHILSCHLQ